MTKIIRSTAFLALITAFVLGIGACKKDAAKSKTELLTQSSWKVIKEEAKSGSGPWVDITATLACEKDNLYVFSTTSALEFNEGATKCNPADPQILATGTWTFLTNETQLQITAFGSTSLFNLDQLDDNTMVISRSENVGGVIETQRSTVGH